MTPEQILSHPPKVLSQEQRQNYFELGYVKVEGLIPKNTLVELRRVIDKVWDASKEESQSGKVFCAYSWTFSPNWVSPTFSSLMI